MRSKMWTLSHTCSGEAYACVAEEMKHIRMNDDTRSERVDPVPGILYMNFDVGISPCEMARHLNVTKIGTFQELAKKYMTFEELDQCSLNRSRCMWDAWQVNHSKAQILNASGRLETLLDSAFGSKTSLTQTTVALLQRSLREGTWMGFSGLYYLPKQVGRWAVQTLGFSTGSPVENVSFSGPLGNHVLGGLLFEQQFENTFFDRYGSQWNMIQSSLSSDPELGSRANIWVFV